MVALYKYYTKNIFEEKIDYSYSKYYGKEFIVDYLKYRKQILNMLSDCKCSELQILSMIKKQHIDTLFENKINIWLDSIIATNKVPADVFLLIKRFEVTKKIYDKYDDEFRPLLNSKHDITIIYLKFSFLLCLVYKKTMELQLINALLKVHDIICSEVKELESDCNCILKYTLNAEINFINEILNNKQIKI